MCSAWPRVSRRLSVYIVASEVDQCQLCLADLHEGVDSQVDMLPLRVAILRTGNRPSGTLLYSREPFRLIFILRVAPFSASQ